MAERAGAIYTGAVGIAMGSCSPTVHIITALLAQLQATILTPRVIAHSNPQGSETAAGL